MNKHIYISLLLITSISLSAQRHPRDFKKIEAYKIQYLTEKLDLSPETAQQFWPIYNQYQKETRELIKGPPEFDPAGPEKPDFEKMDDENLEKLVLNRLEDQKKLAELKIKYFGKFKESLGVRGAANYYRAELDFHRHLMRKLGQRRKNRP